MLSLPPFVFVDLLLINKRTAWSNMAWSEMLLSPLSGANVEAHGSCEFDVYSDTISLMVFYILQVQT